MAKKEILSAAEHFSQIRASRNKTAAAGGGGGGGSGGGSGGGGGGNSGGGNGGGNGGGATGMAGSVGGLLMNGAGSSGVGVDLTSPGNAATATNGVIAGRSLFVRDIHLRR